MQSSDFEKNIIFIFPRVENVENPLSIRIWALPEELTQGISQNVGALFSKRISFSYPQVENVENPLYFRIWALPEELAPVNCKNVGVENVENPHHFRIRPLPEELAPVKWWKTLKIHFISGSQLSLRSYRKAYFKMLCRTQFRQKT
ncbi:hypothetical protein E2320_000134 [Naja naja]|nr:hypothetical protein E2320_000134 [Naja naja]